MSDPSSARQGLAIRRRLLRWLVQQSINRRRLVFISSLAMTLVLGAAWTQLHLDVRWTTLVPESLPVVKEYQEIDDHFLQPANMIIAIRGPDPVLLERITDEVTEILRSELLADPSWSIERCKEEQRYARFVYGKLPEDWLTEHLLSIMKPRDAERMTRVLHDPRLLPYLIHLNDDLEAEYVDAENVKNQEREIVASLDAMEGLVQAIETAGSSRADQDLVNRTVRDLTIGRPYMSSLDKSMSLVMVASAIPSDDIQAMPLIDKRVEKILAPLAGKYPGCRIERTGEIPVARDEMDSVGPQSQAITLIALILIFLLLVWNFRSGLTPLFALLPIVIGIIWSVGVIAVTLGSMNVFTVMIGVVLLGLGIDFSLHISNRFQEEMAAGRSVEDSLRYSIGETGTGVLTGAVTTAVAFLALMVADARGIREFGLCAGTGVLVTLAAVFWILPALLASWTTRQLNRNRFIRKSRDFALLGRLAVAMGRWRWGVIPIVLAATTMGIWAGTHLDWEWNFMELEPAGLRSIELQEEIIDEFKISMTLSMLIAETVDRSRELRTKLKKKGLVGDVDDISLWVSRPDFDENQVHIRRLRKQLEEERNPLHFIESLGGTRPSSSPAPEVRAGFAEEVDRLWANIVEIQALSFISGQDRVLEKTRRLVATREDRSQGLLRRVADRLQNGESVDWSGLEQFSAAFTERLRTQAMDMARSETRVSVDMIPPDIRAKYTSRSSPGFLMQVFPKKNLYEREDLEAFQDVVSKVHPSVTGFPQMMLNMNLETIREGKVAFWTALAVILVVLLLDFRRPLLVGIAVLPLLCGLGFTLGILWLIGEKLHYVNVIGLPVIIGIGVDDGVHFLHRYIREGRGQMAGAVTGVGRAMLMTSLTTMIGFGSLMLYLMRGMASLGLVLFVGVGMCLLISLTLLPALTRALENYVIPDQGRRRSRNADARS